MKYQIFAKTTSCAIALAAATSMAALPAVGAPIRILVKPGAEALTRGAAGMHPFSLPTGDLILADYHDDDPSGPTKVHRKEARDIIRRLNGARALCGTVVRAYRIDCLADQYDKIVKSLPKEGEFKTIRAAVDKASKDLAAIASANHDTSVKQIRPKIRKGGVRARASRQIKAIQPARQVQAERQATAVVDQLSTVLLRSGENSGKRQVYFAQIAQAVDSNKVLLRSA